MTKTNEFGQPIGDDLPVGCENQLSPKENLCWQYMRGLNPFASLIMQDLFIANQYDKTGEDWTYLGYGPFESFTDYVAWLETVCESVKIQCFGLTLIATLIEPLVLAPTFE